MKNDGTMMHNKTPTSARPATYWFVLLTADGDYEHYLAHGDSFPFTLSEEVHG
jgi:hypothetical protein